MLPFLSWLQGLGAQGDVESGLTFSIQEVYDCLRCLQVKLNTQCIEFCSPPVLTYMHVHACTLAGDVHHVMYVSYLQIQVAFPE